MTPLIHTFKQPFQDAMVFRVSGIHVVTTDGAAGCHDVTMTVVTLVTDESSIIMLYTNREAGVIPMPLTNRDLCINILSHRQQDIAGHFAGTTNPPPEEHFTYHIWNRGQNGQLEVEGALAQLHRSIIVQKEVGAHFIFLAQINEIKTSNTRSLALLYFRRSFRSSD